MEKTANITTATQLGDYFKLLENQDKTLVITAANKYTDAKRSCGDIETAYIEFLNIIKEMAGKYNFNAFETNADIIAVVDKLALQIELATKKLVGERKYTCIFNSIEEANAWLLKQDNIVVHNFTVETTRCNLKISKIKIEYSISENNLNKKIQITEKKKIRFFFGSNPEKFRRKWEEENSQYTFITSIKRKWGFSLIGGSVGYFRFIKEKYIVLYSLKTN